MTLRTRPTSLLAGVMVASVLPARSALRRTVRASARGSFCMFHTSGVLLEAQVARGLAEAVAAEPQAVAADHRAHLAAAAATFVDALVDLAFLDDETHV